MAIVTLQDLIEAGVHFGHRCSRWNPKMKPYIYGKRNQIHIIDLKQTVRGLLRGANFLERLSASGGEVLFVGTKPQVKELLKDKEISEDEERRAEDEIQKLTDQAVSEIDEVVKGKEQELLAV